MTTSWNTKVWLCAALTALCIVMPNRVRAQAAELDAFEKYELDWVRQADGSVVVRADIAIDADPDVVWALVRDPNGYAEFSKNLCARVDSMAPGSPIWLNIQLYDVPFPTISLEHIGVFDDAARGVSWIRDFGFGQVTDRWQVVVPEGEGAHYYTALKFPKELGWFVEQTLAKNIQAAFQRFAAELRDAAEAAD